MITVAVEKHGEVHVYGENNRLLFLKSGQLYGFTSTTVSVKRGGEVCVYDAKGSLLSLHYVG